MRLAEGWRLRVTDIGFEEHQLLVCDGKGEKDRVTLLPTILQRRTSVGLAVCLPVPPHVR
ncbi:MAG: hypothetical protein KatS3mg055_1673 [Chloroflexus sp.]|nr:MAG: hypothetical protein KatS3mg055_1673 [Chloroflexus sp.]